MQEARIEIEFTQEWIKEHFDLFLRRVFDFHQQYSSDYFISVDDSRVGRIKYIANQKEIVDG